MPAFRQKTEKKKAKMSVMTVPIIADALGTVPKDNRIEMI